MLSHNKVFIPHCQYPFHKKEGENKQIKQPADRGNILFARFVIRKKCPIRLFPLLSLPSRLSTPFLPRYDMIENKKRRSALYNFHEGETTDEKTTTCAALALAALFAFAGCAPNKGAEQIPSSADTETESAGFEEISPEEAKELIGEANVVLLDVRTQEEYDEGHIEGAVLLPYDAITADSAGLPADKDATIIIYCRSGRRSLSPRKRSSAWLHRGSTTWAAYRAGLMPS